MIATRHAVMRYAERILGIDVMAVRSGLVAKGLPAGDADVVESMAIDRAAIERAMLIDIERAWLTIQSRRAVEKRTDAARYLLDPLQLFIVSVLELSESGRQGQR